MAERIYTFVVTAYSIITLNMRYIVRGIWKIAFLSLFFIAFYQIAVAHDATLQINRTNAQDLELNFSLDLITTLQRSLAPRMSPSTFVARYANMPITEFNEELVKAKAVIENEIRIEGSGGNVFIAGSWQWPSSDEIQTGFKQAAEIILINRSTIGQMPLLALTMLAHSKTEISRIHLSVGPRLRPILLLRPNIEQFLIDDFSPDAMLDF